ncbi:MAG TPA: hypothetical protein VMV45_21100 [Casimicrobiaceae bacterium]|nr:hypothetical protein [Casimicrobiaceae bacterium]
MDDAVVLAGKSKIGDALRSFVQAGVSDRRALDTQQEVRHVASSHSRRAAQGQQRPAPARGDLR